LGFSLTKEANETEDVLKDKRQENFHQNEGKTESKYWKITWGSRKF